MTDHEQRTPATRIIASCDVRPYRIPFANPVRLGDRTHTFREGMFVRLTDADGAEAWGEIAPLPEFSREDLDEARAQAERASTMLVGAEIGMTGVAAWLELSGECLSPSVAFGLDLAFFRLTRPVLSRHPAASISLARLVLPKERHPDQLRRRVEEGWGAIKLKAGRTAVDKEIDAILAVCDAVDDSIPIRIDANRSWSLAEATRVADALAGRSIEFLEEPLRDPTELPALREHGAIPIALDESLREDLPEELICDMSVYVIKPMLVGGMASWDRWIRRPMARGVRVVLSSAFEFVPGLTGIAEIAMAYGCTDGMGLDTAKYFDEMSPLAVPDITSHDIVTAIKEWSENNTSTGYEHD